MKFGFTHNTLLLCLVLFLLPASQLIAEEQSNIDELMQGFDDSENPTNEDSLDDLLEGFEEPIQGTVTPSTPIVQRSWDLVTLISLSSSYNYQHQAPISGEADYRGLSRFKVKLQPELRYKFNNKWDSVISANGFYDFAYTINGRDQYTSETLDTYESELEFREAYIRGTVTRNFDIKVGRQIVVWGKSDSIRVVDVLNPLDFREPGMVDIEDLRLPITMLKADYYFDQWNLSAIAIPEIRFNKMPAYGSDFYVGNGKSPSEEVPNDLENFEFALALEGIFSGWDLSFYFAKYYDDQAHMILNSSNNPIGQKHSQLNLLGAATNIAFGDWLLKVETAFIDGLEFASTETSFSRADILLGVDYAGFTDTTLTIEAVNRKLLDYEDVLLTSIDRTEENEGQIALRYSGSFMHDKVKLVGLIAILGTDFDAGAYYRGSIEYEIMNATSVTFGGIAYQSGDNFLLKNIAQNDRLFFDIRYSF